MTRYFAALLVVALTGEAFADPVIYSQMERPLNSVPVPPLSSDLNNPDNFSGLVSTNFTQPPFPGQAARVYDNFEIAGAANQLVLVTDVHFYGQYASIFDVNLPLDRAESFDFLFWSDNGGQPGSLLHQTTATATETFIANGVDPNGAPFEANRFDADLGNPFLGLPNTQYWLSIVANLPASPLTGNNVWDWRFGFGDDVAYQDADVDPVDDVVDLGEGRWFSPVGPALDQQFGPTDFAFDLTGQVFEPIPEPGSLAVWCTVGAVAIGIAVRRRRLAKKSQES